MPHVHLGPFLLHEVLGTGGMGEVWAGTHRGLDLPVAIKVVRGPKRDSPAYQRAFRNEVRAVANLDHPNVVRVLDADRVSAEAAEASGGRLQAGAPYLVMERLQTDLRHHTQPEDWRFVREVARDLLAGLAHAHARGILHRDVKPANVLMDARGRAKLTDFGLAQLSTGDEAPEVAGTPTYMAPEQLFGRWREAGPWTDLYAVGAVIWEISAGAPPYGVLQVRDAVRAHAVLPLPGLLPRLQVPGGLEAWLRRLLRKDPHERYQRAADALAALDAVDQVRSWVGPGTHHTTLAPEDQPTELTESTDTQGRGGGTEVLDDSDASVVHGSPVLMRSFSDRAAAVEVPPISTIPPPSPPPSPPLLGVGMGLVAQRPPPLVGREDLQELLWTRLVTVHVTHGVESVWLHGAMGFGKTRLAEWLLEASHAAGAAHTFKALHVAGAPPRAGIAGLFATLLAAEGLKGQALHRHLAERMPELGVADDLLLVRGILDPDDTTMAPSRTVFGCAQRLLQAVLSDRPGVLLLDDVALSAESMDFARYLVRGPGRRLPLLLVLTTDDELLAERPAAQAGLRDLRRGPRSIDVAVGPLPRAARRELVRGLLGVDSPLVDRVEAQTNGHPLFAVELVRSWVEEGSLRAVDGSYRLAREARRGLPPDLARVWTSRLHWALRDRPPSESVALEVGAVLGDEVRVEEWLSACASVGVTAPGALVDGLCEAGLLVWTEPGVQWSFAHRMLREAVLERAQRHGRAAALHGAAAQALEEGGPGVAGRRGRHLLAAGHRVEAVDPLIEGLGHAVAMGDAHAELLLEEARDTVARAGLPPDDPRRATLLIHEESLAQFRLDARSVERIAEAMLALAERNGWPELALRGNLALAGAYRLLGRHRDALPLLQASVAMLRASPNPGLLARMLHTQAVVHRELGEVDLGRAAVAEAMALCEAHGLDDLRPALEVNLVALLLNQGQVDEAARRIVDARSRLRPEQGSLLGEALMLQGEVARRQGRLQEARAAYAASRRQYLQLGHDGHALYPALNAALVCVLEDRFQEAEAEVREVLRGFQERDATVAQVFCHAVLLPCLAATGRWAAYDASLSVILERIAADGLADDDVAALLARAARFARQAGRAVRADTTLRAAQEQYRRLGRPAEADALERRR